VNRKMNENRVSYKQLLIESLLTPAQSLCGAAVHVENAITYVPTWIYFFLSFSAVCHLQFNANEEQIHFICILSPVVSVTVMCSNATDRY